MDGSQRAAYLRLVILCAAWALGEALVRQFAPGLGVVVPALLAAAAFVATSDLGGPGRSGEVIYWRGRRIDRDRWDH